MATKRAPTYRIVSDDADPTTHLGLPLPEQELFHSLVELEAAVLCQRYHATEIGRPVGWWVLGVFADVCDAERLAERCPVDAYGGRPAVVWMELSGSRSTQAA